MTICAVNPDTGERFLSSRMSDPRGEIKDWQSLVDPITFSPVLPVTRHFRKAGIVRAHFRVERSAQWPSDVIADSEYINRAGGVGESMEHLVTKEKILSYAPEIDPALIPAIGTTELRIAIPGKGKYRIADVAFDLGYTKFVFEVQYSPITTNELTERTDDYFKAGCEVQWVFGPKNQSTELEQWHESFIGFSPILVYPSESRKETMRCTD